MQIQLGTSSKRVNSTAIPVLTVTKDCVLKNPCTVETPVIELESTVFTYSVAYIPAFGRYYFVTNIESVSNTRTRYYLTVDVLASFKERILANTVFVSRSESNGVDTLPDPYATHDGMTPNIYQMPADASSPGVWAFGEYSTTGIYVVQTAGPNTNESIGESVNTYALTASQMRSLITDLFTANTYDDSGTPTVDGSVKTYFNPFQYIISCKWFPIPMSAFTFHNIEKIKFGWWEGSQSVNLLDTYTFFTNATIVMPSAVDWTYCSPEYSRYIATIPGFGNIEIDPVYAGHNITVQIFVDMLTGSAKCELYVEMGSSGNRWTALIASASGYWAVDVLLTQLASDATNLASTTLNSVMGLGQISGQELMNQFSANAQTTSRDFFGVNFAFGVLEAIPFVGSYFKKAKENLLQPALSMNGAVGDMTEFKYNTFVRLTVKHYDVLEPDMVDTNGLPCNRNYLLSNLSGFTICNNASVEIQGATMKEKLSAKSMLEGGFWIE